jgi:hypothetical protein
MDTDLTPDQEAEARRLYDALKATTDADLRALARLLAAKADADLLGATEFQVRDAVHRIGARALETALAGRKKGGTTAPAAPAPAAAGRPSSKGTRARRSRAPWGRCACAAPTTTARTAGRATAPGTRRCG